MNTQKARSGGSSFRRDTARAKHPNVNEYDLNNIKTLPHYEEFTNDLLFENSKRQPPE